MAKRLPSLNLLRVFEAAGRRLSFKLAAEELHISPPAVSHQIRVLEKELGVPLFTRLNRAIALTADGLAYYGQVHAALTGLQKATDTLVKKHDTQVFSISSIPFITNMLLIPHIKAFRDQHPSLRIQIRSQIERAHFGKSHVDVAIRHRKGDEPELCYEPLTDIFITPVCSPDYLAGLSQKTCKPSRRPAFPNLLDHRIIRLSVDLQSWPHWATQWGHGQLPEDELSLDNYQAVLDAARQGMGLAMGYLPTLNSALKNGELILPFKNQVSAYGELYLVYRHADKQKAHIKSFRNWMKALIKQFLPHKNILSE